MINRYEYVCNQCGHIRRINEAMNDIPCTECEGGTCVRQWGPKAEVRLKGSDFTKNTIR